MKLFKTVVIIFISFMMFGCASNTGPKFTFLDRIVHNDKATVYFYRVWANIYYVADSEIPACTIRATTIIKTI